MPKFTSTLAILIVGTAMQAQEATPLDALAKGKASLEIRTRYEHVDDDVSLKTADAPTNRLVLTYKTAQWEGLSLTAQFENVAVLGSTRYFVPQTGYGRATHATVVDQPLSGLNQLFVEWKGLKAGRQVINLDNQRFVGSVGWRQNDQVFTGLTYALDTQYVALNLGHLTQAHLITGFTKPINGELINVDVKVIPKGHIRAFYYAFDEQVRVGSALAASTGTSTANSFKHTGARVDGDVWKLFYDVSMAKQDRTKDATLTGTLEADYRYLGLGFRFTKDHSLQLTQETLEPGFKTPYATLHAWNGWVDRFLATPTKGLEDTFPTYKGKVGAWTFEASHHTYKAETDGTAYGKEWNALVGFQVTKGWSLMAKAGSYAGDAASAPGALSKDTKKFWLQSLLKF
ncbi:MAG: hypothetical protein HYZ13_08450 [Acidobacteria bacterium]|nr:hypothetical protein [Acidobacteriota bacterium]